MVPEQIQEMITEDLTPDSDVFLAIYLDATPDVIEPEAWFVHLRLSSCIKCAGNISIIEIIATLISYISGLWILIVVIYI